MKKIMFKVAGLALVGILAACGSSSTTASGSDLTASSPEVGAATTAALDDLNLSGAMVDSNVSAASLQSGASVQGVNSLVAAALTWNIPPRAYALLRDLNIWVPAKGSAAAANCTIIVTNATTAPQRKVVFACTGTNPTDSRTYTTNGELDLTFQDGTDETTGYTAAFVNFDTLVKFTDNSSIERKLNGNLAVDRTAWLADNTKPITIQKSYTHSVIKNNTAGTALYNLQNVFLVNKTYQPDNAATPGLAGNYVIPQSAPGTNNFTNELNSKTHSLSFFTNTFVHWNSACTTRPRFDGGEEDYTLTNSKGTTDTLALKFTTGCNYTVTFDGSAITPVLSN